MKINHLEVGSYIKELRIKRGITQTKLAKSIGVSDSSISNWEKGSSSIEIQSAADFCELFDISLAELFSQKFRIELINRRYYEITVSDNRFRGVICLNNDTLKLNVISHEFHDNKQFGDNYGCYQIITFDDIKTAEYFEKNLINSEFLDIEMNRKIIITESELVSSSVSRKIRF